MRHALTAILLLHALYCTAQHVSFDEIQAATDVSFRGLSVIDDKIAWLGGTRGTIGVSTDGGNSWSFQQVEGCAKCDFRTVYAFNAREAIIANAGQPAGILRTFDGGATWKPVHSISDTSAFIDGAAFWNDREGIVYGDPLKGHMLLLRTDDAGLTWRRLPGPALNAGEASFAASGTTIRCYGSGDIIIATGGKVSRLWMSHDKGNTWSAVPVPVIQGSSSAGIFSFAFSGSNGVIVGGDYLQDTIRTQHCLYSADSGKHWLAQAIPTGGYRECVEYLAAGSLLCVGPSGADVSNDNGRHWISLGTTGLHVVRKARMGSLVIAAGKGKIMRVRVSK